MYNTHFYVPVRYVSIIVRLNDCHYVDNNVYIQVIRVVASIIIL